MNLQDWVIECDDLKTFFEVTLWFARYLEAEGE